MGAAEGSAEGIGGGGGTGLPAAEAEAEAEAEAGVVPFAAADDFRFERILTWGGGGACRYFVEWSKPIRNFQECRKSKRQTFGE